MTDKMISLENMLWSAECTLSDARKEAERESLIKQNLFNQIKLLNEDVDELVDDLKHCQKQKSGLEKLVENLRDTNEQLEDNVKSLSDANYALTNRITELEARIRPERSMGIFFNSPLRPSPSAIKSPTKSPKSLKRSKPDEPVEETRSSRRLKK
jgi:chaperonin cofactor prefoldin